jgi:hypothetical protein
MGFRHTDLAAGEAAFSAGSGLLNFAFVRAWRERKYAFRCCKALRTLHANEKAANPLRRGVQLYVRVVELYLKCDLTLASMVVERAAESYAIWPQTRELKFRDVAHFLIACGLCQETAGNGTIAIELKPLIHQWLPSEL